MVMATTKRFKSLPDKRSFRRSNTRQASTNSPRDLGKSHACAPTPRLMLERPHSHNITLTPPSSSQKSPTDCHCNNNLHCVSWAGPKLPGVAPIAPAAEDKRKAPGSSHRDPGEQKHHRNGLDTTEPNGNKWRGRSGWDRPGRLGHSEFGLATQTDSGQVWGRAHFASRAPNSPPPLKAPKLSSGSPDTHPKPTRRPTSRNRSAPCTHDDAAVAPESPTGPPMS